MADLKMGNNYDGATPQYDSTTTRIDQDGREVEAFRVQSFDRGTRVVVGGAPPEFGPNDTPATILGPVERDIEAKRELLSRSNGFDPRTGEPNWTISGERRAILQRELTHLTEFTLPLTKARAEQARRWHAAQPTSTEKLIEQREHRAAIFGQAKDIADRLEAEKEAERILRLRRSGNS